MEDHGDLDASKFGELFLRDLKKVFAIIDDLTVFDDLVVGKDTKDGLRGDGLTRARLTDDGHRSSFI